MSISIIPEEKMKECIKYCTQHGKSTVICSCGSIVDVEYFPYYYDKENNDVHFASVCPICGALIITKE